MRSRKPYPFEMLCKSWIKQDNSCGTECINLNHSIMYTKLDDQTYLYIHDGAARVFTMVKMNDDEFGEYYNYDDETIKEYSTWIQMKHMNLDMML